MRARNPQLSLRLDAAPPAGPVRWAEGARVSYLGGEITLHLSRDEQEARLDGETLHLPLPPESTLRQIQDRTEAWLQAQAILRFNQSAQRHATRHGTLSLPCVLSFATRTHWVIADIDCLRCHWRLIEQPVEIIEQVIAAVVAGLPRRDPMPDLFGNVS